MVPINFMLKAHEVAFILRHAGAQTLASEPVLRRTIHVPRDKSLSFRLPQAASKIVIAQPEIAKVTATSDSSFYVQGIEFGSTNMLVYSRGGALTEVIDIRVGYDAAARTISISDNGIGMSRQEVVDNIGKLQKLRLRELLP